MVFKINSFMIILIISDFYFLKQQTILYFLMNSKIKSHKRNNAIQAFEQNSRFSVPINFNYQQQINHQQLNIQHNNYRASDYGLKSTQNYVNHIKKSQTHFRQAEMPLTTKKTSQFNGNLRQMFDTLQGKLDAAKKHLIVKDMPHINQQNFELNSYQNSLANSLCETERKKLNELQQSTINFQSKKALINMMKSKERLIIANKIKTYYVSEVVKGTVGLNDRAIQHLNLSIQIFRSCSNLKLPNQVKIKSQNANLTLLDRKSNKKILVLDLDQTLFHCFDQRNHENDLEIIADLDNVWEKIYISIRPYAISFLKRMQKYFNIVAFTASEKCYADAILNEIDPSYQLIQARLYRHHCVKLNDNIYAKDLRIISTDISKIVLVDNSPFSCLYQLDNCIPIIPYYGGQDSQLLSLEKYLEQMLKTQDVRKLNNKTFKLNRYNEFQDPEQLVKSLYCNI